MYRHFAPFDDFVQSRHPTLDLSEHDNDYIVETEVPGVKKENLEVVVGDNGRSLTIKGGFWLRRIEIMKVGTAGATESEGDAAVPVNGTEDASTSNEVAKPTLLRLPYLHPNETWLAHHTSHAQSGFLVPSMPSRSTQRCRTAF